MILIRSTARAAAAVALAVTALALGACAHHKSDIAIVNIETIQNDWPKFQNYRNQLQANLDAIRVSKLKAAEKQRQLGQLAQQSARWQAEVTNDVRGAAASIAKAKNYSIVVTRQGVAYGGDDITPDVEKALNITPQGH